MTSRIVFLAATLQPYDCQFGLGAICGAGGGGGSFGAQGGASPWRSFRWLGEFVDVRRLRARAWAGGRRKPREQRFRRRNGRFRPRGRRPGDGPIGVGSGAGGFNAQSL